MNESDYREHHQRCPLAATSKAHSSSEEPLKMNDDNYEPTNQDRNGNAPKRPRRRSWSDDEKRVILSEAELSSVSAAAKKYDIAPSQVFAWRERCFGSRKCAGNTTRTDPLAKIQTLEQLETAIVSKLLAELQHNKTSAYNASCAFANLVNCSSKFAQLKSELEVNSQPNPLEVGHEEDSYDREMEREAERMLLELVKTKNDWNSGRRV